MFEKPPDVEEIRKIVLRRAKVSSQLAFVCDEAIHQTSMRVFNDQLADCMQVICTRPVPVVIEEASVHETPDTWWDHFKMTAMPRWMLRWFKRPAVTVWRAEDYFPDDPWPGHKGSGPRWYLIDHRNGR